MVLFLARLAVSTFAVLTPAEKTGEDADRGDSHQDVDEILEPSDASKDRVYEVVVKQGDESPVKTTNDEQNVTPEAGHAFMSFHKVKGEEFVLV